MNIWQNAVLTNQGLALQAKLIEGSTLTITRAVTGSGYVTPGLLPKQTAVTSPQQTLSFRTISYPETGKVCVPAYLTNDNLTTGYTAMQVGVYAKDPDLGEILYFIAQAESGTGTVIPSATEMPGYSAEWNLYFQYGQADSVNVTVDPSNTVTHDEAELMINTVAQQAWVQVQALINPIKTGLDDHIADTNNPHSVTAAQVGAYTKAEADSAISAAIQEQSTDIIAPIKSELEAHEQNKSNPHNVTKSQVGLGNVPNVTTNNQTPTYTAAASPAALSSGETLTTAFGKIAAAVSSLISHIANKSNPHTVTYDQVAYFGLNPITTTANDTTANWIAKGTGYAFYNTAGQLNDQPARYGFLISYVSGTNIFQIWRSQGTGPTFWRSGNTNSGWMETFTKVYDTDNKPSASDVNALPISGGTLTGALTLAGAPTADLQAATKLYVDNQDFYRALKDLSNVDIDFDFSLSLIGNDGWMDVAFGAGKWVAISATNYAVSTDGINWTSGTMPSTSGAWKSITYGNGMFVAVSNYSSDAAYSSTGTSWTKATLPGEASYWTSVAYGNGKFVAVASGSATGATSTNGTSWTSMNMPESASWEDVAYGNNKFVAVARSSALAAYSGTGTSWTKAQLLDTGTNTIAFGNGLFVAGRNTQADFVQVSTDGITWTKAAMPVSQSWYGGIAWGGAYFIAIAYYTNVAAISTDGYNWTQISMPASIRWTGLAFGKNTFVAVASRGGSGSSAAYCYITPFIDQLEEIVAGFGYQKKAPAVLDATTAAD